MKIIHDIEQLQELKKANDCTISKEIEILAEMQKAIIQKSDGNEIQSDPEDQEDEHKGEEDDDDEDIGMGN
jgi:hypothetical protein